MRAPLSAAIPIAAVLIGAAAPAVSTAQPAAKDADFFESKVRPVLVSNCYSCHGPAAKTAFGNLRLTSRESILKGGDSGPAVIPGNAAASLLVRAVRQEGEIKMPPSGPMKPPEIDVLAEWVNRGAPWGAEPPAPKPAPAAAKSVEERRKDHWAWQPVRRAQPPKVAHAEWPRQALDQFLLARLERANLAPAADADPYTLLRRLYFTLTGLPPNPEEVDAFVKDPSEQAFEAAADKLIRSPYFGEKWGRQWLDSTYFADTIDVGRRIPAVHAWRYRDYVIESFNQDKPFDRMIREQVAGDLLPFDTPEQRRQQIVATGFLSLGPWALVNADKEQLKMDVVDLQIDLVGKSFLGLTLACSRCHDHKFDPIPQKNYYAVAGILASTQTLKGIMTDVFSDLNRVRLPETAAEAAAFERETAKFDAQLKEMKSREEWLEARKKEVEARLAGARGAKPPEKAAEAGSGGVKADASSEPGADSEVGRLAKESGEIEGRLNELKARIKLLEFIKPTPPMAFAVEDAPEPRNCRINVRGNAHSLGEEAPRGFVEIATLRAPPAIREGSGRRELAEWLASPANPLTARVYVNRVWHAVFGAGIVRTLDNFGSRGEAPSHPELLDYLASRFVEEGWSVKKLVRQMVLSRAFRMSGAPDKAALEIDPENRLLWRMNRQRLSGEEIRDAMLRISGQLDEGRGGPSLALELAGNLKPFEPTFIDEKLRLPADLKNRRTVYLPVLRKSQLDALDMLNLFGFPDANQVNGQRAVTNVPTQALYLMNSPFYHEQSLALARLSERRNGLYDRERVAELIRLVYNRPASEEEIRAGLDFVSELERALRKQPKPPANATEEAWTRYCQTLFASSEFLFKS